MSVRDAFVELMRELKRAPTQREIAKRSGLSINAVQRHLKKIEIDGQSSPTRALKEDVIAGLAVAAMNGKAGAAKLYFRICFGEDYGARKAEATPTPTTAIRFLPPTIASAKGHDPGSNAPRRDNEHGNTISEDD